MPFLLSGGIMIKKLAFLSVFNILFLSHAIGKTTNYHPLVYKTIKFANIDFDDHIKALDLFIAKWKLKKDPTPDSLYEEPKGIVSGLGGIDVVYENSKYISQLILASRRPLVGIKKCHDQNEERLTTLDAQTLNEAVNSLGIAYATIREYSIRIYNAEQNPQDLTDLHATRAKIIEGQAKLQEILARGPQKKN